MRKTFAFVFIAGLTLVAFLPLAIEGMAFADDETNCQNWGCDCCEWRSTPGYESTTVDGNDDFSHDHVVFWCYQNIPFMGQFTIDTSQTDSEITDVGYSPSYFFPQTHYGELGVTITGHMETTGTYSLFSKVEIANPYSSHVGELRVTKS